MPHPGHILTKPRLPSRAVIRHMVDHEVGPMSQWLDICLGPCIDDLTIAASDHVYLATHDTVWTNHNSFTWPNLLSGLNQACQMHGYTAVLTVRMGIKRPQDFGPMHSSLLVLPKPAATIRLYLAADLDFVSVDGHLSKHCPF